MTESGYYPPGAEHDPNAPFNEPLNKVETRYVSVTLSFETRIRVSLDATEDDIYCMIKEDIKKGNLPKKYDIDELVILE